MVRTRRKVGLDGVVVETMTVESAHRGDTHDAGLRPGRVRMPRRHRVGQQGMSRVRSLGRSVLVAGCVFGLTGCPSNTAGESGGDSGTEPGNLHSNASEAEPNLARISDGCAVHFAAVHACPGGESVDTGVVPPLAVTCHKGPGGACRPVDAGSSPTAELGEYAADLWSTEAWKRMEFEPSDSHRFHYRFLATNDSKGDDGYGTCQFTIQAFADLDGDGVFSTYERRGTAGEAGVEIGELQKTDPYE